VKLRHRGLMRHVIFGERRGCARPRQLTYLRPQCERLDTTNGNLLPPLERRLDALHPLVIFIARQRHRLQARV
jgi:hypothetical protein